MMTAASQHSPVDRRERERTRCARRPQLRRASRPLEPAVVAAAPDHRSLDLVRKLLLHEAVFPRRYLRRTLTPRRARIRDRERGDRIAAGMTATMVPSAANRGGVERSSPSNAGDGGSDLNKPSRLTPCIACQMSHRLQSRVLSHLADPKGTTSAFH
jgi:hypothetical protein